VVFTVPVIGAILPVRSDVMTVSFTCHRTGTLGSSQPPFGKEKKITIPNGGGVTASADLDARRPGTPQCGRLRAVVVRESAGGDAG
jgi:hypothetical protein